MMGVHEIQDVPLFDSANCILSAVRMTTIFSRIPAIQYIDNGPGYAGKMLARKEQGSRDAKESDLLERVVE